MWQAGVRGCAQYCSSRVCCLASGLDPLDLTSPAVPRLPAEGQKVHSHDGICAGRGGTLEDCGAFIAQTGAWKSRLLRRVPIYLPPL